MSNTDDLRLMLRVLFNNGVHVKPALVVRNLGVLFDPTIHFDLHVKSLTKMAFSHP